jgi:chaperonin GroEL
MIVKEIHFGDDGQKKLKSGIKKIAGAVKSTLGARGRTVLIESENHVGGITVTKDGVTVAKSINLYDPTENLAVIMMRQAADKTATVAGDGTTTSIVLAEAIIDAADKYVNPEHNVTEVIRKINGITKNVVSNLEKRSKKVSGRRLYDVASISANNDTEIGKMIGDAFSEVSLVTVENSMNSETRVEIINGMRIERGYTSPYFVTDQKKQECVLDNPYVLICDHEINNISNLEKILAPIVSQGKSLLIIGNIGPNALQTLNVNVYQGKIKACNIMPPSFGYRQKDLLKDLAVALGGTYFSEDTGDDLSIINLVDLGKASKVIVTKDMTVFMHNADVKEEIDNHIIELKAMVDQTDDKIDREFLRERIANISGGIGVIYVGAQSDIEQKEKRDRIDDAVYAVMAALEEGILPGGGIALAECASLIDDSDDVASKIMYDALIAPFNQILINAGKNPKSIALNMFENKGWGYDVKNEKAGDMIKMGIIDPTKVTKNALLNAVSVATTIMSTNAIITNIRADESTK